MLKRRIIQNLRYLISTSLDVFSTMKVYPAPVHHQHVKPINGSALMSPIPTTIPIIQILNFVIIFALNIQIYFVCQVLLFFSDLPASLDLSECETLIFPVLSEQAEIIR